MERYLNWVAEAARGDLGHSFILHAPVWSLIRIPFVAHWNGGDGGAVDRLVVSLTLGIAARGAQAPCTLIASVPRSFCWRPPRRDSHWRCWLWASFTLRR